MKIGLKYYKKAWKISKQSNELYGYNYGITMMVDTNGRSNLKLKEIKQWYASNGYSIATIPPKNIFLTKDLCFLKNFFFLLSTK